MTEDEAIAQRAAEIRSGLWDNDLPLGSMQLDDRERRLRDPYLHRDSYREDWS